MTPKTSSITLIGNIKVLDSGDAVMNGTWSSSSRHVECVGGTKMQELKLF